MPDYFLYALVVFAQIMSVTIFVLILRHARRKSRDQAAKLNSAERAQPPGDGPLAIRPVATFIGIVGLPWWVGVASNSNSPELVCGTESMSFSVLRHRTRRYDEIVNVDLRTALGSVNLTFRFKGSAWLFTANMGHLDRATRVLKKLPTTVPLMPRAAALISAPQAL